MTKTEEQRLLKLVEEGQIEFSSIGVFLYIYHHKGMIVTIPKISKELCTAPNTLKDRLRQLKSRGLIKPHQVQRGVIIEVLPIKSWSTSGTSYTSIYNSYTKEAKTILADLNKLAMRKRPFKLCPSTLEKIGARLEAGFTLDDFKRVHQNMKYWLDNEEMSRFYRPETLYRSNSQFQKYLDEESAASTRFKDTTSRWEDEETKREVEEEMRELARELEE